MCRPLVSSVLLLLVFFFNDTATTEIYTLSLHDALPISAAHRPLWTPRSTHRWSRRRDRKSTRLNSSHVENSYAVFCLKKKKRHNGKLTEKIDINNTTQLIKLYERLLPYAMLFVIEREWAKQFSDLYHVFFF